MATPLLPVDGPQATPPRTSLVNSALDAAAFAAWNPEDEAKRTNGFTFAPESCGRNVRIVDRCEITTLDTPDDNPDVVEVVAYEVRAYDKCSTLTGERDREGRVRRLLAACESKQIASELWTGTLAQASSWPNRYLASPEADEVTSGATDPFTALACLERGLQLCSCGGRGMIHASAEVVTLWSERGVLRREGNTILTIHDTIVVTDAGYDGSSPDGDAATSGSVWAYATGLVYVYRGPVTVYADEGSTIDRATNDQVVWAQRPAAATWGDQCCHKAAQLDIDLCTIGGS